MFQQSTRQIGSCMFLQAVRHRHMRMDTAHLFLLAQISFSSCRQTTSSPMLAWIPFPLYRQAFSRFSACLDSSFSIRQAFPRFSVCLNSVFSFQAVGGTLKRLSRLQISNLDSNTFQEFTVPFLKIQSRQFIMTEIHCLNGINQKQPVANHCLFAQIQMRTVNSLIISLSECQIRKRDSYKGHFTSHEGSVPSGEVFSDKIRVSE